MSQVTDIKHLIELETQDCMSKKKGGNIFNFFKSTESFRGTCELQATRRHGAALSDAQSKEYQYNDAINQSFLKKLGGGFDNKTIGIAALIVTFVIIVLILVKF